MTVMVIPNQVKTILNKFHQADFEIYIVGGGVRDLLMGRAVKDWDFTTDATPQEIVKVLKEGSTFGEPFYDNKFGTVGIPINSQIYEITTMRKESEYTDFRHPQEVIWTDKIEEDLARRDFTVNAMALDNNLNLVDPFAGQRDLDDKIIKAVGNPIKRFQEDALRLMRAIRIAAELGFIIEENTFEAIKQNATLITKVSGERVRDELFKILSAEFPYEGLKLLRNSGLLQQILPEVEECFGIVQQGPKHARIYDIGEHSFLTVKFTPSKDSIVKLAALLHDIGKVPTHQITNDNVTFYGHDVVGGAMVSKIADRLRLSKKDRDRLYRLVRFHLFTVDEKQTDSAVRRFIKNVGIDNLDDMWALREGDRLGGGTSTPTSWRLDILKQRVKDLLKKPFTVSDLKVSGHDVIEILGIKPGPKVGEILDHLFQEVLEDASKNNREYLLKRIKELE